MSAETMTPASLANLFAALAKAASQAGSVGKDARNEFHKYKYASAESIYSEAREFLHANGLTFTPIASSLVTTGDDEHRSHVLELVYLLGHSSGESLQVHTSWPVIPDRGRPLDKALAAARTTALAYTVRDTLLMPRVDEEVDRREDKPTETRSPKRAPKGPPSAPEAAPTGEAAGLIADIRRGAGLLPKGDQVQALIAKDVVAAGSDVTKLRAILKDVSAEVEKRDAGTAKAGQ